MFNIKGFALVAALAFAQTMSPAHYHEAENCFPESDIRIPVFSNLRGEETTGITEEEFNIVLDELEEVYGPVLEEMGKTFKISRRWTDSKVNASAQQSGDTWTINMYGGLARHKHATVDSFRAVACHELGHHLGGAPKKSGWFGSSWASNEGQSDYFATYKCLKKLIHEGQAAGLEVASADLSIYEEEEVLKAEELCAESFEVLPERIEEGSGKEGGNPIVIDSSYTSCVRTALAGLSLGRLLGSVSGVNDVSFTKHDAKEVTKTYHNHPKAQCRADTYMGGATCNLDFNSELDDEDANIGTCNRKDGFDYGLRSLCWFKPELD